MPNIPYCCLPQESGPCLSTSVGDRPLRSPTHRRLGGPSPRLLSNGTHARPPPRLRLAAREMPPTRRIRYYPAFPPAIPARGVGCIRVTHPSATLTVPKDRLPYDLHVLGLPLAFILSQDQTLRCSIVVLEFFFCVSGSASMFSLVFLCYRFLASRRSRGAGLVLASDFQRTRSRLPSSLAPRSFRKRVQKYYLFPIPQALFSIIFPLSCISLIVRWKKLQKFWFIRDF